jgi:hypothetical protein
MGAVRILRDHLAKLYQFLDDFSRVGGAVNDSRGIFRSWVAEIPPEVLCLRCDMAKSVTTPTCYHYPA